MSTIVRPAPAPSPTSDRENPVTTSSPSPPAPTRPATTTSAITSRIVWLTASVMYGRAMGSSTLRRSCQRVEPNACPASITSRWTARSPSVVARTAAGSA
jgi:hypothetical protein